MGGKTHSCGSPATEVTKTSRQLPCSHTAWQILLPSVELMETIGDLILPGLGALTVVDSRCTSMASESPFPAERCITAAGVAAGDGYPAWIFLSSPRCAVPVTSPLFLFQERRGYHRYRAGEGVGHPAGQSDRRAEGWGAGSLRVRMMGQCPLHQGHKGAGWQKVALQAPVSFLLASSSI